MVRTVKNPEVRRKEIVDIAKALFEEKGYEHTSVENIIHAAGIAKGTFYYYFKTKKEVLEEVVKDMENALLTLLKTTVEADTLPVLDKVSHIFTGADKVSLANTKVMDSLHRAENRELQEKLNICYIEKIIPLITDVFNQGYQEQLWTKEISLQKMQIILGGSQFILDSALFTWNQEERQHFLKDIQDLLECTIGAAKGTFNTTFNALT